MKINLIWLQENYDVIASVNVDLDQFIDDIINSIIILPGAKRKKDHLYFVIYSKYKSTLHIKFILVQTNPLIFFGYNHV